MVLRLIDSVKEGADPEEDVVFVEGVLPDVALDVVVDVAVVVVVLLVAVVLVVVIEDVVAVVC